jgi:D-glycero-D-manno-heptose 1,7-bisphosphate phosphatase
MRGEAGLIDPGLTGRSAVFLDRDGVLNAAILQKGVPYPPPNPQELVVLPGVADACRQLHDVGLVLVMVTNQPDVARGSQTLEAVRDINDALQRSVFLDAAYVCPHDDVDQCRCRKPAPGLLLSAAADLDIDLSTSVMVGDRWRDIEAGRSAGCATVHIDHDYDERRPVGADLTVASLPEAVAWIICHTRGVAG